MAKKTNDETIDLLYLKENKKDSNKSKAKNKNVPKKPLSKEQRIDLDNEIIIGLTPKKTQSNKQKEQHKSNKKNKSAKTSKKQNSKLKNKKLKKNTKKLKILKWTCLAVCVIVLIILFIFSPVFNIKNIEVDGIKKLTKEEIINLSQLKIDENMFKMNSKNVENALKNNNNYIEKVDIKRELPNTVRIIVKERIVQYIVETIDGNAYVDENGYILEMSTERLDLPVLTGYETEIDNILDFKNTKKLSDSDCRKLKTINEIIEMAKTNSVFEYITSIDIEDGANIKLVLANQNKIAYLGDGSNANLRILYMKKMIEEEKEKEGEMFIDGDITTLKPKPYFREKI